MWWIKKTASVNAYAGGALKKNFLTLAVQLTLSLV